VSFYLHVAPTGPLETIILVTMWHKSLVHLMHRTQSNFCSWRYLIKSIFSIWENLITSWNFSSLPSMKLWKLCSPFFSHICSPANSYGMWKLVTQCKDSGGTMPMAKQIVGMCFEPHLFLWLSRYIYTTIWSLCMCSFEGCARQSLHHVIYTTDYSVCYALSLYSS
jgi:hypothetical protein